MPVGRVLVVGGSTLTFNFPGAQLPGIAWQLRRALQWESAPFDAILLVGGWSDSAGDPVALVQLLTGALQ